MKRFLPAILVGLALLLPMPERLSDQGQQSGFIRCNLLWSAKLPVQAGNPYLLARKAPHFCAGQDAAYERVMQSVLRYKEIADRYMRKVHASQLLFSAVQSGGSLQSRERDR